MQPRILYTKAQLRRLCYRIIQEDVDLLRELRKKATAKKERVDDLVKRLNLRFKHRHYDTIAGTTQLKDQDQYYYHWEN